MFTIRVPELESFFFGMLPYPGIELGGTGKAFPGIFDPPNAQVMASIPIRSLQFPYSPYLIKLHCGIVGLYRVLPSLRWSRHWISSSQLVPLAAEDSD